MKNYPAIILFLFISCNTEYKDDRKQSTEEIIQTDIAMSNMAAKAGFFKALLAYADDSVMKPTEGEFPVIGKKALEIYWEGKDGTKQLSWEPFRAEASRSGDLGYTLGTWKFARNDSTLYGNYYTIWKKQADGKWKFVFDGGNGTPAYPK